VFIRRTGAGSSGSTQARAGLSIGTRAAYHG
jgi:hypothetical protein